MLRFQQYIELVRTQDQSKLLESIVHAKKYLLPFKDSYPKDVQHACGLLAFPPGTRAGAYEVSPFCPFSNFLTSYRNSTANPAGQPLQTSLCKPITAFLPFLPSRFSMSPSQPVSLPSKPHRVTPCTSPPYPQPQTPQSPPPSAQYAAPSSTTSLGTCLTHIIPKVMLKAT